MSWRQTSITSIDSTVLGRNHAASRMSQLRNSFSAATPAFTREPGDAVLAVGVLGAEREGPEDVVDRSAA